MRIVPLSLTVLTSIMNLNIQAIVFSFSSTLPQMPAAPRESDTYGLEKKVPVLALRTISLLAEVASLQHVAFNPYTPTVRGNLQKLISILTHEGKDNRRWEGNVK